MSASRPIAAVPARRFRGALPRLARACLAQARLTRACLAHACLARARLARACLAHACLARARLARACLAWACLACLAPLLALVLALAPAAGAEPPVTLDQLMAAFRTVRHVEARYVEQRTLSVLRTPLETTGTLRFDAPDRLEKIADPGSNGPGERVAIDGDRLTIDRGNGTAPVVLSLSARPEIGVLVESIRATLSGDGTALGRTFGMTLAGTIGDWDMVLQPRDPALRAILDWMRIDGHGPHVTAIETQDREGDRSRMVVTEQTP